MITQQGLELTFLFSFLPFISYYTGVNNALQSNESEFNGQERKLYTIMTEKTHKEKRLGLIITEPHSKRGRQL